VRVSELVSHRLPVARAREAFELAMGKAPGTLKVLLDGRGQA
jgi:threonine dehydrogenase-like Zn-dependent dehydrogenase